MTTCTDFLHVSVTELARVAVNGATFIHAEKMNNADRAALVAEALCLFSTRTGLARAGEDVRTVITDFLADLMHLCHAVGIDRDELPGLMMVAEMHFDDEVNGEG
ncbi:TPA: hypothetical protein ACNUIJ_003964 [Salmonella enterica subsp. enterica serovar Derby]